MEASEDIFVNDTSPAPVEEAMAPSNAPVDADGEGEASVEGLIPLCARHAAGPLLNLATFGYDIAQMERRPWREPGAKLSDYFNYGFNETSWRVYCAMQAEGEASLLARARETLQRLQLAAEGEGEGGNPPGGAGYDVQPYAEDNAAKGGGGGGGGGGGYRAPFVGHHPMFNYKTKLCQRFAEGRCTKGGECTYAHGIGELRTAAAPPTGGGSAPMAKAPAYLTPPYQHGGGGYGGMPPPPPNTG